MARVKSWTERLAVAEKRGYFTKRERVFASQWNRCAVGEKHDYPRVEEGAWANSMTRAEMELGLSFLNAVEGNFIEDAKKLYLAIQALP
jgi:hypothetical protein